MESEQVLKSQSIFEGKILNLRMDVVNLPDGSEASREVVEHKPAVVAVPVDSENNVILVRQYRYAVGQTLLETPAGRVEESETPDEAVQREIQEEIGLMQWLRIEEIGVSLGKEHGEYLYQFFMKKMVKRFYLITVDF